MNKFFVFYAASLLAFSASGQGVVRRVATIAELQSVNPAAVAVSGQISYTVTGYTSTNVWPAPRIARWDSTSAATIDNVKYFATATSGRWVFDDVSNGSVDVTWANAIGNGVANDTAAIQLASSLVTAGNSLTAPPGRTFILTDTVTLTNNNVTVNFNGSTVKFRADSRKPAFRIGPAPQLITTLDFALVPTTNYFTGVTASTFAAGDMVLLYNNLESPADYNPGLFAFVTAASGTTLTLDRFPYNSLQVTNAYRFPNVPSGCVVENINLDLSGATNAIGISAYGKSHIVRGNKIYGTGTTNDPNYIGIELRGQALVACNNMVKNIIDAGNATDRAGYGIFLSGDSVTARDNEVEDCKHTISTSERHAVSFGLRAIDNVFRQRGDWALLRDSAGSLLFSANLDAHANTDSIEIRGNQLESWGSGNLSLRGGEFTVVNNNSVLHYQPNISQFQISVGEALVRRCFVSGNNFDSPNDSLVVYFSSLENGTSGTHSNMQWVGNVFNGGIFRLQDSLSTNYNTMVDTLLLGNHFYRAGGTPLFFAGPVSNLLVSANHIRCGANGITLAVPGTDATVAPRQIFIDGNSFIRESGVGYDVNWQSGPTNIVLLGQNKHSSTPTFGILPQAPVGVYSLATHYPLLSANSSGDLLFGQGSAAPTLGLHLLNSSVLEFNGAFALKASDPAAPVFGTYLNTYSNRLNFFVRADGLQGWTYAVWDTNVAPILSTNTTILAGPRRLADLSNGVYRLTGAFGLTERVQPITPEGDTVSFWLDSDLAKAIKLRWPDGSATTLWHSGNDGIGSGLDADYLDAQTGTYYLDRANHIGSQSYTTITGLGQMAIVNFPSFDGNTYGVNNGIWTIVPSATSYTFSNGITNSGGVVTANLAPGSNISFSTNATRITISAVVASSTNGTPVSVNGGPVLLTANFADSTEIDYTATGTNITSDLTDGSVSTNRINATFHGWIAGKQDSISFSTGVTNASGVIKAALAAGANVTLSTNAQTITIAAVIPPGTNSWQFSVDGAIVTTPNLDNSVEIDPTATGTNVTFSISNNSIATNKIDTTFHGWISGKQNALTFSAGVTNSAGIVSAALARGTNIVFTTNANTIEISAVLPSSTNLSQIGVDGVSISSPNLSISSELDPWTAGTNIYFSLVDGSISTNRIDSAFYTWVQSQSGTDLSVDGAALPIANLKDGAEISVSATSTNVTFGLLNGSITTNRINSTFSDWINTKDLYVHGTRVSTPNLTDTTTVELNVTGTNVTFTTRTPNNSVTYSKIQQVTATNVVLGRGDSAFTTVAELQVGPGLITTPTTIQANFVAGTNVVLTTNANAITINAPQSGSAFGMLAKALVTLNPQSSAATLVSGTGISAVDYVGASWSSFPDGIYADWYDVTFSSTLSSTNYMVLLELNGNTAGVVYSAGVVQDSKTTSGFQLWRWGLDQGLTDGYQIKILVLDL